MEVITSINVNRTVSKAAIGNIFIYGPWTRSSSGLGGFPFIKDANAPKKKDWAITSQITL